MGGPEFHIPDRRLSLLRDAKSCTTMSMRAPRKARSDRDSSKWDLPGRTSEGVATGSKPWGTCPSACRGGRNSPSGSRRWPASSSCSRIPGPDPTPFGSLTSHRSLSKAIAKVLSLDYQIRSSRFRITRPLCAYFDRAFFRVSVSRFQLLRQLSLHFVDPVAGFRGHSYQLCTTSISSAGRNTPPVSRPDER